MNQISTRDRTTADAGNTPTPGSAQPGQSAAQAPAAKPPAKRRSLLRPILMLGGIGVVVVGSGYFWLNGGRYMSTDDAYVQAAEVNATTDVSGIVGQIDVHEGDTVKAGQPLFRLGQHHFQIALDGARAKLAQTALMLTAMEQDYQRMLRDSDTAKAQVAGDQASFGRYASLIKSGGVTRAEYDDAKYKLQADQANVAALDEAAKTQLAKLGGDATKPVEQMPDYLSAQADVAEAQRQLDHTIVRAPFNGIVTNVESLQRGQYLMASASAFGIVSTDDVFITAQPKETQLTHVREGQPVTITVDSYPGSSWKGEVQSIAPASGSQFSLLPAENSSGNWVKVVQRIPVRIKITGGPTTMPLRAGMSVVVSVDTGHIRHVHDLIP
ncbi:HlyD family secretion protein [Acidisoma cladoniae]|jgi:membrane fusion protein (multidrug efflux system)|uniref:HlyD family secretion protein n=1 Tax=Acidisoma cladoniae TaxID=3040935 RepID=UPI00254F592C|nr:HlyD family secretion protein [Acidisoma sp. PAMC 29798]